MLDNGDPNLRSYGLFVLVHVAALAAYCGLVRLLEMAIGSNWPSIARAVAGAGLGWLPSLLILLSRRPTLRFLGRDHDRQQWPTAAGFGSVVVAATWTALNQTAAATLSFLPAVLLSYAAAMAAAWLVGVWWDRQPEASRMTNPDPATLDSLTSEARMIALRA